MTPWTREGGREERKGEERGWKRKNALELPPSLEKLLLPQATHRLRPELVRDQVNPDVRVHIDDADVFEVGPDLFDRDVCVLA